MAEERYLPLSEMAVPFHDVDMNGSMFLASYITYAEAALEAFWSRRPTSGVEPHYTVSKVSLTIRRPLAHRDPVRFVPSVDKIGIHSVGFMVVAESRQETAAEIEIIWQSRDPDDGSFMALPEETRDWLYGFLV
ncbi:acyl-CoA thioesterase [Oryzifoliimicrobium ureilyticus]|uniref:acyl-CoA thioesterase n=1 Tax=Oryzifoliimicrobium ureilyticus TaxID=3113724 RepID=UPI003076022A